jgi:hypothetical protein
MSHTRAIHILACATLLFALPLPAGQATGGSPQKMKVGAFAAPREKTDMCMLLTSAEIEAVQGEPVKQARPNDQTSDGMRFSQCLFQMETSAKSVSVAVATPNPARPSALTPRKFWQRQFHPPAIEEVETPAAGKAAQIANHDREMDGRPPRPIDGLGEEAYWVGNPVLGTLYVLQGDSFLRISVGGVREESMRIERSKVLARAVVKRLDVPRTLDLSTR